jgi:hypothetical protein
VGSIPPAGTKPWSGIPRKRARLLENRSNGR